MKDTRKQREKDGPDVKTKSPHSIATPPMPSTSSSPSASNVLKITKKSHTIQKRPTNRSNSMQTKLVSVRNENGTKSVIVSTVKANAAATPIAKVPPSTAAVASAQSGEASSVRISKRPVKTADESKRVATQKAEVEPKVSVEHTAENFNIKINKQSYRFLKFVRFTLSVTENS